MILQSLDVCDRLRSADRAKTDRSWPADAVLIRRPSTVSKLETVMSVSLKYQITHLSRGFPFSVITVFLLVVFSELGPRNAMHFDQYMHRTGNAGVQRARAAAAQPTDSEKGT